MRTSLIFISIYILSILANYAQDNICAEVNTLQPTRYTFEMAMSKGRLSGILITKESDNNIMGSMVNEFGISAFSFTYDKAKDKIKLENVIGFLDRWYIKKLLSNDIKYCVYTLYGIPQKNKEAYSVEINEGLTIVTNKKRKITYSFSPMTAIQNGVTE